MAKRSIPTDPNLLAKYIVDLSARDTPPPPTQDVSAVALGCLGVGGKARAKSKSLSASRRKEIAKKAAQSRWKTKTK